MFRDVRESNVTAILFDMDGVIRSGQPERLAREEAKLGIDPEVLRSALADVPALWQKAATGEITDEEFRQAVTTRIASFYGEDVAAARAQLQLDLQRPNVDLLALIARLRTRYSVGVVSNATARLRDDLVRLGLHETFDAVVVSALVGVRKPDPGIYLEAARMVTAAPQQCVFVDDNQPNVDGATAVGMHGLLFTSTTKLVRDLEACGLA